MIELTPEQYTAMKQHQELVALCDKLVSIEETKVSDQHNEKLFAVAMKYLEFWTHPEVTLPNNRVRDYYGMGSKEKVSFEHQTNYIIDDCFNSAELFLEEYYKRIGEEV